MSTKERKKKNEHEHNPFPSEIFELTNYTFVIVKIKCSDENCDWTDWDWGTKQE